ncbi:MAG TPA: SRPBCC family protein [Polyangiaceae bacterium]|nr:SRPBCC family protein [Polyangiaceae bacterium]
MVAQNTDRIEKQIFLRAPRSRVWRALTQAEEFGSWFGVQLEGKFAAQRSVKGRVTTKGYEHISFELQVQQIEPESYFSYRWHPYSVDPAVDYSKEPTTLVEFRLEEVSGGTQLHLSESGFEQIPLARRAEAFRMNDGGWTEQMKNIERHVAA